MLVLYMKCDWYSFRACCRIESCQLIHYSFMINGWRCRAEGSEDIPYEQDQIKKDKSEAMQGSWSIPSLDNDLLPENRSLSVLYHPC